MEKVPRRMKSIAFVHRIEHQIPRNLRVSVPLDRQRRLVRSNIAAQPSAKVLVSLHRRRGDTWRQTRSERLGSYSLDVYWYRSGSCFQYFWARGPCTRPISPLGGGVGAAVGGVGSRNLLTFAFDNLLHWEVRPGDGHLFAYQSLVLHLP